MALAARGASDKEIGGVLGISTATAQKHVTNLLRRLGAPNRAAAVAMVSGHLIGSERAG
jgi:DNA-binding CsgD family transcriptional regulator